LAEADVDRKPTYEKPARTFQFFGMFFIAGGIAQLPVLLISWSNWFAPAFALNAGLAVLAGERILERIFHVTERS